MKTFEEAVQLFAPMGPISEPPTPELIEASRAIHAKYQAFADQARDSEHVRGVVSVVIRLVACGELDVESCLFNMFVFGLEVGMEMEKREDA